MSISSTHVPGTPAGIAAATAARAGQRRRRTTAASGRVDPLVAAPDADFDAFFHAHYDGIVRTVAALCGDRETASDAVQEAFVRAYARWGRLRRYDNPATWVRRVAINRSRDLRRSDERRRRREDNTRRRDTDRPERPVDEVAADGDIMWLFDELTPRQRTVAALYYLDDVAVTDIAATLRISPGAVKFHLNKARQHLRVLVDESDGTP